MKKNKKQNWIFISLTILCSLFYLTIDQNGPAQETTQKEEASPDHFQAAELLGIHPGKTTLSELANHPIFQKPVLKEKSGNYDVWAYRLPDVPETPYVQLLIQNNVIAGVIIHLGQTRNNTDAKEAFNDVIQNLTPITIKDNNGNYRELYPEKGFSFVLAKGDGQNSTEPSEEVIQIVTETVKPDFFLTRADIMRHQIFSLSALSKVRQDAETVLKMAPDDASAHWLLAETAFLTEDYDLARESAARAVQLNDKVPEYHFTMMKILNNTGLIDDGLRYLEAVVPVCEKPPFFSAELAILRGEFLRKKVDPDYDRAMREAQVAISVLKPEIKEETGTTSNRLRAKELMARAYLLLGHVIAAKDWKESGEKEKAFLWVAAADKLLTETVEEVPRSLETVLNLGLTATEIGLNVPSSPETDSWVDKMIATGDAMLEKTTDPAEKEVICLKCGEALFNAFLIADAQENQEKAEKYAQKSLDYLEPYCKEKPKKILAVIGPVDYEFGLFFNENDVNHEEAMTCLTRAGEIIAAHLTLDGSVDDGDHGIRLVNIGKAFWSDGQKEKGLEMTRRGVEAIEKGVEAGNRAKEELIIPCQNLTTIYTALGDSANADLFAEKVRNLNAPPEK